MAPSPCAAVVASLSHARVRDLAVPSTHGNILLARCGVCSLRILSEVGVCEEGFSLALGSLFPSALFSLLESPARPEGRELAFSQRLAGDGDAVALTGAGGGAQQPRHCTTVGLRNAGNCGGTQLTAGAFQDGHGTGTEGDGNRGDAPDEPVDVAASCWAARSADAATTAFAIAVRPPANATQSVASATRSGLEADDTVPRGEGLCSTLLGLHVSLGRAPRLDPPARPTAVAAAAAAASRTHTWRVVDTKRGVVEELESKTLCESPELHRARGSGGRLDCVRPAPLESMFCGSLGLPVRAQSVARGIELESQLDTAKLLLLLRGGFGRSTRSNMDWPPPPAPPSVAHAAGIGNGMPPTSAARVEEGMSTARSRGAGMALER
mmetsp:Transcript_54221/g.150843  ORF Transcript_54221/g.150843 Transcript_54221/m.150843 type:complete len:381 (+) Transcript_54221:406-1548(+)